MRGFRIGRRWAVLFFALALLLRLAVPAGWMPAADRIGLMPCAGTVSATTAMPMMHGTHADHHGTPDPDGDKGDRSCPFVGFAAALAETDAPGGVTAPSPSPVPAIAAFPAAILVGLGLVAPPPPPTGPPATA